MGDNKNSYLHGENEDKWQHLRLLPADLTPMPFLYLQKCAHINYKKMGGASILEYIQHCLMADAIRQ